MQGISKLLTDPSWWFSGLFFTALLWLTKRVFRAVLAQGARMFRGLRLQRLRRLKRERGNPFLVQLAIGKANANYVLFMLFAFGFLYGLLFTQMRVLVEKSFAFGVILGLPVLVVELAWLRSDDYAKDLIGSRARLKKD